MKGKVISATKATVKTATIQVKVIQIDNRQMTLAVFRQLESFSIIDDETGKLSGDPWGWVNYHPDSWCGEIGLHKHVVWEFDGSLYRSIVVCPRDLLHRSPYSTPTMSQIASHLDLEWVEDWGEDEKRNYEQSWNRVTDSEQLFIAV